MGSICRVDVDPMLICGSVCAECVHTHTRMEIIPVPSAASADVARARLAEPSVASPVLDRFVA